jgi:hypothetical protein
MRALCKKYYRIGGSVEFFPNQYYNYEIRTHMETNVKVYYVDGHPMLNTTFIGYFDDLQQRRDEIINKILNEQSRTF